MLNEVAQQQTTPQLESISMNSMALWELSKHDLLEFISIDGLDGTGKRTQAEALATLLNTRANIAAVNFSFPNYNTATGKLIKLMLQKSDIRQSLSLNDRLILYSLNRLEAVELIQSAILDKARQGKKVICILERGFPANLVSVAAYAVELINPGKLMSYYNPLADPDLAVSPNIHSVHPDLEPATALTKCIKYELPFWTNLGLDQAKLRIVYLVGRSIAENLNTIVETRTTTDDYEVSSVQFVAAAYMRWFSAYSLCTSFKTTTDEGEWISPLTAASQLEKLLSIEKDGPLAIFDYSKLPDIKTSPELLSMELLMQLAKKTDIYRNLSKFPQIYDSSF